MTLLKIFANPKYLDYGSRQTPLHISETIDSDNFWRYSNNFLSIREKCRKFPHISKKFPNRPEHFLTDWNIPNSESSVDVKIRFFVVNQTLELFVYQFSAFCAKKQALQLSLTSPVDLFGEIVRYFGKSKCDFQEAVTKIFLNKKSNILIFFRRYSSSATQIQNLSVSTMFLYSNFGSKLRYLDFQSTVTR